MDLCNHEQHIPCLPWRKSILFYGGDILEFSYDIIYQQIVNVIICRMSGLPMMPCSIEWP